MKTLVKFFVENYKLTLILSLMMAIFGYMGMMRLNSESYPAVDFAMATVETRYNGASAEDIETKITKPIEDEIRTVSGIKDVRSVSQPGRSSIFVRADMDNVDVKEVMSDLQKAVDRATGLPNDLENAPKFQEIKSEEFPVIEMAIIGSNENRQRDLVADALKEELEDNKKVLSVREVGFKKRRFHVELNKNSLSDAHIGINEITANIELRNKNIPGGSLRMPESQKLLRLEGKVEDKGQLENVLVRSNFTGSKVYVKDIANVVDGEEEGQVLTRHNGKEATLLIVTKKAGADTLELVREIDVKIESFKERYRGQYEFKIYNNEAQKVKNRLEILSSNAITGLALVIVFLLIFLPGRVGIMASLSLPLAVMATFGFMPVFGMNLNAITILALVIALGMLVDNSVVISENFNRLRSEGISPMEASLESVAKLWLPITATAFTTIAAFLPMLVTKGIMGQFIKWIPVVVTIALILSLFESFIFLPMRLVQYGGNFYEKNGENYTDWFQKIIDKFEGIMTYVVRHRYITATAFIGLIVVSLLMMTVGNKFILFPPDETEIYIARVTMPTGTRVTETDKKIGNVVEKIKAEYGENIKHMVARAGTSKVQLTDPKAKDGNEVGMVVIYVDDFAKYEIPSYTFLENLRKIKFENVDEVTFEALVNGPPVGDPVNATFRSNNMENLDFVVNSLKDKLSAKEGIVNVKIDDVIGDDEVYINIDYDRAAQLGLDVNTIGNAVRTAVSGRIVETLNLDNKEVDIFVRMTEDDRRNIDDLKGILVMDNRGNLIPLGSLASFEIKPGTAHIKRFDFKRSKTLTAQIVETKMTAVQANAFLDESFKAIPNKYSDVSMVFGGEGESTKESMESLWSALVLSLMGIFALLVFLFSSYLRPLIIMSTIPLGLVGFSVAFALHGRPISFLALIGVIGLGGIIVNSGIVLISFIDDLKKNTDLSLEEILIKASGMRLKAVLVSSLTTISGLLPTAYGIGGSDALLVPMTLAMAWGLTSGTFLTLIWVPAAYALLEDLDNFMSKVKFFNFRKTDTSPTTEEAMS